MKRLTIKLKITLYFTLIMFLLGSALLFYTTTMSRTTAQNELKGMLTESVDLLYEKLHYKTEQAPHQNFTPPNESRPDNDKKPPNGFKQQNEASLVIPDDIVYKDGNVRLFIYETDSDSNIINEYGELPDGVAANELTPNSGRRETIECNGDKYFIYTKFLRNPTEKNGGVCVVGTINAQLSYSIAYDTLKFAFLAVPFVIVIAAVFGYLITKRAFGPVTKITNAAAEIAGSNDLSRRINISGDDEISKLAQTFDGMLDTIQRNYEKEKQFTNDASHELRTPVAVIMAQSELALDPNATENDLREAAEIINRQSHKMSKLLSKLLSLARADNHKTVLEKESFDLCELAEMVVEEQKEQAKKRNIDVRMVSNTPVNVFADQTAIMGVLINFIDNAIKYGKYGGYVEVSVTPHGENGACCIITDNGIGISDTDIPRIWDRFYRADTSRTDDGYNSMGLGLAMAKTIVEAHGGFVSLKSTLGEGSEFSFTI